jgi:hypothetical protein
MDPEPSRIAPVKLLCGLRLPQAGRCRPQTVQTRPDREDVCPGHSISIGRLRQHAYWVNDLRWRTIVSAALLLALWLGYIVYSNPGRFVGAGFVFAPLIAFCILDARSAKVIAARVAAFAIAFALIYAVGPVDYIRTLFAYSSRIYFYSEWRRAQDAL